MFQNFFPPFSSFFNSFPRFFSEKSSNQSKVYGDIFICLQAIRFIVSDLVNRPPCAPAYVDDFAAVTGSSDSGAAVNHMQCMLKKVNTYSNETGLEVDPDKIELVASTRKHKVPTFTPPSLGGKNLEAEDSVNFLRIKLDSKLNWIEHLEKKIRKFLAVQRNLWGKYGLKLEIVVLLYMAALGPKVVYASVVRWPKTK